MLGNEFYQNPAVGDYDPESPRPNTMTGTTGPSSVLPGAGESQAMAFEAPPPPPPPPMMNLPGHFTGGQGLSKIPGPGSTGSAAGGVAPPLWPPSKLPTMMGKPPRSSVPSIHQQEGGVSRTSSLQSGSWNTRSSFDAPPMSNLENLGGPPMMNPAAGPPHFEQIEPLQNVSESHQDGSLDRDDFHAEQGSLPGGAGNQEEGESNRFPKMPPPAIAKESPLKAFYAKGTEGYEKHRKKINLNISLDSVAQTNRVPTMVEENNNQNSADDVVVSSYSHEPEPPQQPPAPPLFSMPQPGSHQGLAPSYQEAPEPASFESNQGIFESSSEQEQLMGGDMAVQPEQQPPPFMGGESTMQEMHEPARPPVVRKKKGFFLFKKRFILLQAFFLITLAINPSWVMTQMTVAGAVFQSGLTGYALVEPVKFRGMLHSQFPAESSVHMYIDTIENSFTMVTKASESAWDSTESALTCSSSSITCRWAKSVVHISVMTGAVSKECLLSFYRAIPGLIRSLGPRMMHFGHTTKAVVQSGNLLNPEFLQGWMREKASNIKDNVSGLLHGTKDFTICAARTSLKSGTAVNLSRNIILCWTSSFERFLKAREAYDHINDESEVKEEEEYHYDDDQHPYMEEEDGVNATEMPPSHQEDSEAPMTDDEYNTPPVLHDETESDENDLLHQSNHDVKYVDEEEVANVTEIPSDQHDDSKVLLDENPASAKSTMPRDPNYDVYYMDEYIDEDATVNKTEETMHVSDDELPPGEAADSVPIPHEEGEEEEEPAATASSNSGDHEEYPGYSQEEVPHTDEERYPMTADIDVPGSTHHPPVPVEDPELTEQISPVEEEEILEKREPAPVPADTVTDKDTINSEVEKEVRDNNLRSMLESNPPPRDDDSLAHTEEGDALKEHVGPHGSTEADDLKAQAEDEEQRGSLHQAKEDNTNTLEISWIIDTSNVIKDKAIHTARLLVDILGANKAHIITAVVSAIAVSAVFLIQGYVAGNRKKEMNILRTPKSVIRVNDISTPEGQVDEYDHQDDEPLTVYKSARSTMKRRSKVNDLEEEDYVEEEKTAARRSTRRRASSGTAGQQASVQNTWPRRSTSRTRTKTRSRSSSRKEKM